MLQARHSQLSLWAESMDEVLRRDVRDLRPYVDDEQVARVSQPGAFWRSHLSQPE